MARITPRPPPTQTLTLTCLNPRCPACGGPFWFAYENHRTITTLEGVIAVKLQVRRCVNRACAFYHRPYRPELEGRLALPHHEFGLDVIAWIGARRYQDHRTVAEIHQALTGQGVRIAPRTVDALLQRYEEWVSVTLASPERRTRLRQQGRLIIAIDGLQPDKGHEVLWVVREVLSGDVLLARSLLASGCDDLSALLRSAVADLDDLPVVGVVSDGQMALRQAVAGVFPQVPHQLCQFHCGKQGDRFGKPIGTHRKNCVNGSGGYEPWSGRLRTAVIRKPTSSTAIVPPSGAHSATAAIPHSRRGDCNSNNGCPPSPPASTGSWKKGGAGVLASLATAPEARVGGHRAALAGVDDCPWLAAGGRLPLGESRRRSARYRSGPVCRAVGGY